MNGKINIALSGGSSPKRTFEVLAEKYNDKIDWSKVHLYWVDERCVPPGNADSNYGMTYEILLKNISIPGSNVHRMRGEEDPFKEAHQYSQLLIENLPVRNNFPVFDLILLGVGADGHTASIFPDQMQLLNNSHFAAVAIQPQSGQQRITLTGKILNNAERVFILVTGEDKSKVVKDILERENDYLKYPAAYIVPNDGILKWLISIKNLKLRIMD